MLISNRRFTASITYHDSFHRFQAGRSMGNATLEVKLIQQFTVMREEVLCVIFLDLQRVTTYWTCPGAWRSWKDMAWGPQPSASSAGNGRDSI